jgi:hypothetical protein
MNTYREQSLQDIHVRMPHLNARCQRRRKDVAHSVCIDHCSATVDFHRPSRVQQTSTASASRKPMNSAETYIYKNDARFPREIESASQFALNLWRLQRLPTELICGLRFSAFRFSTIVTESKTEVTGHDDGRRHA